jgi:chloramphenicol O-acetyltransferase type A
MRQEINPQDSSRAQAFALWMSSPMPMVTLTKTFNVTRLHRLAKRNSMKFNMLLCWCIGKAASQIKEFYVLPEHGRLYQFDRLAINVIVAGSDGNLNSCDIPYSDNLELFNASYLELTQSASQLQESITATDSMVIGTSAMVGTYIDSIVNQYTDQFCNPMVMWGKYRKRVFKVTLPISFQFHHVQMDGGQAAQFLEKLQLTINNL